MHGQYSERLDIAYEKPGYDYWGFSVNIPLDDFDNLVAWRVYVKSDKPFQGSMILNVGYAGSSHSLLCRSETIRTIRGGWQELVARGVYRQAREFGLSKGWPIDSIYIDRIGIDTAGASNTVFIGGFEMFIPESN